MQLKINEAAKLTGVTVRTLHYYDEIGLLKPSIVTEAKYRFYDEQNLELLQQILFFRELDFPLDKIQEILKSPFFDKSEALQKHKALLQKKKERLDKLISLIDDTIKGEKNMSFEEFDMTDIENAKKKYEEEAREKWGGTDAYKESERRTSSYKKEDWAIIDKEMKELFQTFADMCAQGILPGSDQSNAAVKRWQDFLTNHFYPCTNEILQGLGSMYIADERFKKNLDKFGDGTAAYISDAIKAYCEG